MNDSEAATAQRELHDAYWDHGPLVRLERHLLLAGHLAEDVRAVGLRLSARLGLPFSDTVRFSEHKSGMSFARLLNRVGEGERRDVEARALRFALTGRPFGIVAVSPQALLGRSDRELVRRRAQLVVLDLDFESYRRRLAVLKDRRQVAEDAARAAHLGGEVDRTPPAVQAIETLHRAFRERVQAFDQASLRFEVRGLAPEIVARRLMEELPALRSA